MGPQTHLVLDYQASFRNVHLFAKNKQETFNALSLYISYGVFVLLSCYSFSGD